MKRIIGSLFLLMVFIAQTGCATLADAKNAKGSGVSRIYEHPQKLVWSNTIDVLNETELSIVNVDEQQGLILAQRGITAFSYGENVAVFVEKVDGNMETRIEVVNKRALAANVTAANWSQIIFEKLDDRLQSHDSTN